MKMSHNLIHVAAHSLVTIPYLHGFFPDVIVYFMTTVAIATLNIYITPVLAKHQFVYMASSSLVPDGINNCIKYYIS